MLSKEEEQKLILIGQDIKAGGSYLEIDIIQINKEDIVWLADKLRQVNDECSRVHLELQETNEELARFREHYEGY